jgi:hypothetical protein
MLGGCISPSVCSRHSSEITWLNSIKCVLGIHAKLLHAFSFGEETYWLVDLIHLNQDRDKLRAPANTVHKSWGISCLEQNLGFSCRTLLHGVSAPQSLRHMKYSRDSVVTIATAYGLDDRRVGVRVPVGSRIFSSPCRPDGLWGPPSLLFNGYRRQSGRGVKLTTHFQLVPRSRKCGSIHPCVFMA